MKKELLELEIPFIGDETLGIRLTQKCWFCAPSSKINIKREDCPDCKGSGVLVTQNGEEILKLIKQHLLDDK